MNQEQSKQCQYVRCLKCDHIWPAVELPCPMGRLIELLTACTCTNCGASAGEIAMAPVPPHARGPVAPEASKWPGLAKWLDSGERGASSESIVQFLTGLPIRRCGDISAPMDSADFRRCRLLLEAVPSLANEFKRMEKASHQWAGLVRAWGTLCETMDEEEPDWREGKSSSTITTESLRRESAR